MEALPSLRIFVYNVGDYRNMRSYRDVYEEGKVLLSELQDAALDARLLLEAACGTDTTTLLARPDREVTENEYAAYREYIDRRLSREPVAYILGKQEFMGLTFSVSDKVLIPEQDTEILVEEAMIMLDDRSRILDLCTGSGCILLSLLHYSNDCTGVGTDISGDAVSAAQKNAEELGLSDCSTFLTGDLYGALDTEMPVPPRYDMIISNPPYIRSSVIGTLEPEVSRREPRIALDGGEDGLAFYRRIISGAPERMVIGGTLMMEIGFDQADAVTSMLRDAGFIDVRTARDYGGNDRVVSAVKSVRQDSTN